MGALGFELSFLEAPPLRLFETALSYPEGRVFDHGNYLSLFTMAAFTHTAPVKPQAAVVLSKAVARAAERLGVSKSLLAAWYKPFKSADR